MDVDLAITTARRKRAVRNSGLAGAAALTLAAVAGGALMINRPVEKAERTAEPAAAPVTPPTSRTVEQLPAPDGAPSALISGGDPAGKYFVGRSSSRVGGYQAVIWHDGAGTAVPVVWHCR
ncbi:hypothetical protein [Actinoplanes siamensis]|uniref:Uncharacterized protein n=1 Tax=Actinoplanes siamensis TaxID=1223317 RepID=A0A919TPT5_9ACTN|nr:hypothetical protein [Actinoplanes siamensis]GIF09175.1 hypothetical protein Asi03nite_67130 [Actinoplanes siamensis]